MIVQLHLDVDVSVHLNEHTPKNISVAENAINALSRGKKTYYMITILKLTLDTIAFGVIGRIVVSMGRSVSTTVVSLESQKPEKCYAEIEDAFFVFVIFVQ